MLRSLLFNLLRPLLSIPPTVGLDLEMMFYTFSIEPDNCQHKVNLCA